MSEGEAVINLEREADVQSESSLVSPEIPIALQEQAEQSYHPPVIDFEIPRDSQGRIDWKTIEQNPEHLKAFIESEAYKAQQEGIEVSQVGLSKGNKSYLAHAIKKYYPGGLEQLRSKLQNLELTFDPESMIHTSNKNGQQFGGNAYFGNTNYAYLRRYLETHPDELETTDGIAKGGNKACLFNIEQAGKILAKQENLPQINPETDTYINEEGEWGGYKFFGNSDFSYLKNKIGQARTIIGRNSGGNSAYLFNLQDAKRVLAARDTLPQVNDDHIYTDEDGQLYGSNAYFRSSNSRYLRSYLKAHPDELKTIKGKARGIEALLINLEDAERILTEWDAKKNAEITISPDEADALMRSFEIE